MYTNVITNTDSLEVSIVLRNEVTQKYRYPNIIEYNISLMNLLLKEAIRSKNKRVLLNGCMTKITDIFIMFNPYLNFISIEDAYENRQLKMEV